MTSTDQLNSILNGLPHKPGVYQYFDEEGKIIYVGKAKDLKKRVSSYFVKDHQNAKTNVLVRKIFNIKYIIVDTETDALLLENNLIKKYQPRYNVLLKDDKSFPWICIKNERFPRVFSTRTLIQDGSDYLGPYTSVKMMNTLLDLIRQLYPLRTCAFQLSDANITAGKFKVCLEYHIGKCKGACEGHETEEEYMESVGAIKNILKGNIGMVIRYLKEMMQTFSKELAFEKAQLLKEKIDLLENFQSKSTIVSPSIHNVDVCTLVSDEKAAYANYLRIVNGAIVQGHTIEMKKKLDETNEELLEVAIIELRQRFQSNAKEIIVPFKPDFALEGVQFIIPKIGDKKQLLELSERNAKFFKLERKKQTDKVDPDRHSNRILEQVQKDLHLLEKPEHIECFDNSNFQGTHAVAACVVFKKARPSKKDYRHFNIKTVEGPNDFASMEEVVYRRYKRLMEEKQSLPQLIVIDGGKGQLSSALKSLDLLGLRGKVSIIGIAKRLEEIYFPEDPVPLYIDKKSETLKLIQQLRNEAHRFGISHHRNKRSKDAVKSELAEIKGVGYKTIQKLMWKFKSAKKVSEASLEELEATVSKKVAALVYAHFKDEI